MLVVLGQCLPWHGSRKLKMVRSKDWGINYWQWVSNRSLPRLRLVQVRLCRCAVAECLWTRCDGDVSAPAVRCEALWTASTSTTATQRERAETAQQCRPRVRPRDGCIRNFSSFDSFFFSYSSFYLYSNSSFSSNLYSLSLSISTFFNFYILPLSIYSFSFSFLFLI